MILLEYKDKKDCIQYAKKLKHVVIGCKDITLEEFIAVSRYKSRVILSDAFRERVTKSRGLVEKFLKEKELYMV